MWMKKTSEAQLDRWRKAFASVLAQARRDADLSQPQVAAEMGWSRNTVSNLETGKRGVMGEEIFALARLYGIDVAVLIGRVARY